MAFIITQDRVSDGDDIGTMGPRAFCDKREKMKISRLTTCQEISKKGAHFRMYDDDGNLYYEGYFWSHCNESNEFEPLDCFGMPNAGATEIRIRNPKTNKYETV